MKTMKIIIVLFVLIIVNVNCSHHTVCESWKHNSNDAWIVGCWKVHEITGGFAGGIRDLDSNLVYAFSPDSTFEMYVNDTLNAHGTYIIFSEKKAYLYFDKGYALAAILWPNDHTLKIYEENIMDASEPIFERE